MIDDIAEWDAAYVLGALGRGDRHTYQAYLAANPECAAALTELAGLPGILNVLSRDEAIALTEQAGDAPAEGLTLDLMPSLATAAAMRERRSGPAQWAPPCFRGPDNLPWRRWS
jgi:anti-sigma factor RsiW